MLSDKLYLKNNRVYGKLLSAKNVFRLRRVTRYEGGEIKYVQTLLELYNTNN